MKNWKQTVKILPQRISKAIWRFPLTSVCLIGATGLIWYMISLENSPPLMAEKLMYTFWVGAFIGMLVQFCVERFSEITAKKPALYALSTLLIVGYWLILWPVPELSAEISVRTLVAVFAMLCAVLWIPSVKNTTDFNEVALIHFKSVFTSILYSAVLSAGIGAIIATVDILLFDVDYNAYLYTLSLIWVMFAPLYYLSLLPKFNSQEELDLKYIDKARTYPKFLDILVSYILIPLVAVYTLVLLVYFVKILITLHWPSGQLGPMVLVYSAAGIVLYVLASLLPNRFAFWYCRIFPKALIPIVIMQLISVGIRLNAYGITEARYYVALFGIFSIISGIILSIKPVGKNSLIALLVAGFAIFSIIPPVDAFTVSRTSQINRVEKILQTEGILIDGKLNPKEEASEYTKIEATNILIYLDRHSSLKYIEWLPDDFHIYTDMERVLGFKPTYPDWGKIDYFFANIDGEKPIDISGYTVCFNLQFGSYLLKEEPSRSYQFNIDGVDYKLQIEQLSNQETKIAVRDALGTELASVEISEFTQKLSKNSSAGERLLDPEEMTLEKVANGYKLKIVFQNINVSFGEVQDSYSNYSAFILFGSDSKE